MSDKNFFRSDYDGIVDLWCKEFVVDPGKNYLVYTGHMEDISFDGEVNWEMLNREIPATGFEFNNFKGKEDFGDYIKCYFKDIGSPIRILTANKTAIACWNVLFVQEMSASVYFDFVHKLIEFDEEMGINTMSYENFNRFISSDITDFRNTTLFAVVGPTRPIIWSINTHS